MFQFDLVCESQERGASIEWSRASGDLPENSASRGGYLRVYNANAADAGVYTCTVTTDAGSAFTSHQVILDTVSIQWLLLMTEPQGRCHNSTRLGY